MAYQPRIDEQQETALLFDENSLEELTIPKTTFGIMTEDEKELERLQLHYLQTETEEVEEPDEDLGEVELKLPREVYELPDDEAIDVVGLYLKEMSAVPLLNMEQEVDLAKRIESGKKARRNLNKLNGRTPLDRKLQFEAVIEDGRLAREHLIRANTRLVVSIAKKYMGRGVPFLDLIQEGNLGLMKAVEKFDYHRGFRFSTYATWWIPQTITRAIADQGRTIRLPVHMSDRIRRLYKVARELEQSQGRKATPEEIADEVEVDSRKVQWMMGASWGPLSVETPVGGEEDSEPG